MFEQLIDQDDVGKKQAKLFEQKKKFKNLESDKKAYIEQTVKIIKKQKTSIDKLKKQNQALKDLISKVNKEKNSQTNHLRTQQNKDLLQEITQAIQNEKETQKSIDMHITNFQKKITEKKKNCMGLNSGAQSQSNLQKQIKILENRLDKANQKFNQTTANNKQLKNLIDSLRRQRVIFDSLYKKLEKQLHEKRKKMADIIERANNAYEERDKAHNQIQSMKIQAKKEALEFQKQIKEMSHLMEKIKLSSYAKKTGRANQTTTGNIFYQTQPMVHEVKNQKQTRKGNQQIQKIQKYRQDFAKIQAATEIQNFDELLRIFSENEEKNFQMFKFVNLQSNEIQELEAELYELKRDLSSSKCIEYNPDDHKDRYIDQLEQHLSANKSSLEETKKMFSKNQNEIRPMMNHIERIFETIECDRQIAKELGGNKAITQNNLLVFLAMIEHKSLQIVSTFKQLTNSHMLNQNTKMSHAPNVMLTFDDFEDNEEYNKILTASELREKAKDFIEKQQNQKQKKKETRLKKK